MGLGPFEDQGETIEEVVRLGLPVSALTEATNRSGLLYGDDRYVDQLKTVEVGDSSEQAVDKVWSDVMEHLDFGELSDDCTMLCLKRH